jgi:hypothetical protein
MSMSLSEYLRTLPDSEIMEPVDIGQLHLKLRRERGFPDALVENISQERSRRIRLERRGNQFQHALISMEQALFLPPRTLTSVYWSIRTQVEPGDPALQAIAERTDVGLSKLLQEYQKTLAGGHPSKRKAKRRKSKNPEVKAERKEKPPKTTTGRKGPGPTIPVENVQEMRRRYLDGEDPKYIALVFGKGKDLVHLVTLIVTNQRRNRVPYLDLGVLERRKYERDELLQLRSALRKP